MSEKEFAEIVNKSKKVVLSAIEKNLAARFYHSIDDVAQETYLRAFRSLEKNGFRGDSSIETWLYAIARNESLRMNDKLVREENKAKKSADSIRNFQPSYEATETKTIDEHLVTLPEKYKSVLTLLSQGFNIKDISQKLGIRQGTVKSRTSRGKQMIINSVRGSKDE